MSAVRLNERDGDKRMLTYLGSIRGKQNIVFGLSMAMVALHYAADRIPETLQYILQPAHVVGFAMVLTTLIPASLKPGIEEALKANSEAAWHATYPLTKYAVVAFVVSVPLGSLFEGLTLGYLESGHPQFGTMASHVIIAPFALLMTSAACAFVSVVSLGFRRPA